MVWVIRIKVIRASRLVLAGTVVLLAAALAVLAFRYFGSRAAPVSQQEYTIGQTQEAAAVFAAASLSPREVVFGAPQENEHTDPQAEGFTVEVLSTPPPSGGASPAPGQQAAPSPTPAVRRVLIYHTHTHEAYEQVAGEEYQALEAWRTQDQSHSVVRVGEELARCLEGLGFEVVHDCTDHEPPQLGTAYTRSLKTLEGYQDQRFDLCIDLHRDAWDQSMTAEQTVTVGQNRAARLMMLIGNGEGFTEKPDTQANLAYAQQLTDRLNQMAEGICRPVLVKNGRYNQHLSTPSILVEVGHNKNTLTEALNAMPLLAQAIADTL